MILRLKYCQAGQIIDAGQQEISRVEGGWVHFGKMMLPLCALTEECQAQVEREFDSKRAYKIDMKLNEVRNAKHL